MSKNKEELKKIVIINGHYSLSKGGSEWQCHLLANSLMVNGFAVYYFALDVVSKHKLTEEYNIIGCADIPIYKIVSIMNSIGNTIVYWRYGRDALYSYKNIFNNRNNIYVYAASSEYDLKKFRVLPFGDNYLPKLLLKYVKKMCCNYINYSQLKKFDIVTINNPVIYDINSNKNIRNFTYVPNIFEKRFFDDGEPTLTDSNQYVLWISNIKNIKKPLMFIEIAKRFLKINKNIIFKLAGEIQDDKLYRHILKEMPSNAIYIGHIPQKDVLKLIKASIAVVSTSTSEGLPNVLLQSLCVGVPVCCLTNIKFPIYDRKFLYLCDNINDYINSLNIIISYRESENYQNDKKQIIEQVSSLHSSKSAMKSLLTVTSKVRQLKTLGDT